MTISLAPRPPLHRALVVHGRHRQVMPEPRMRAALACAAVLLVGLAVPTGRALVAVLRVGGLAMLGLGCVTFYLAIGPKS